MALTLPDICAALESDDGRTSGAKYKAWLNRNYIEGRATTLTAASLYQYRCGVVHQSTIQGDDETFRIIFSASPPNVINHQNYLMGAPPQVELTYDIRVICQELIEAARSWLAANEKNANVQNNLPNLIREEVRQIPPFGFQITVIR